VIDNTSSGDVTLTGGSRGGAGGGGAGGGGVGGGAAGGGPSGGADPTPPDAGHLLVYAQGRLVRSVPLNVPTVTIGRTPANNLPLAHQLVSRAHADVRVSPDGVIVTDRGSANGTFVNDVRLAPEQPVQLVHGSVIRIGPFELRYQASAAPSPAREAVSAEPNHEPTAPSGTPARPEIPMPLAAYTPAPNARGSLPIPLPNDTVSSYLDFLPVIFQDGDFLGRFLLIFQSIWEPLEHRQDHIEMYFDSETCPVPFLGWLADWLGINVRSIAEEGRLRNLIGEAVDLYRYRGTRYGLTRMIEVCTGVSPLIVESPDDPAVLHIRVVLPPRSSVDRDTIERLVKEHKPAHTAYNLEVFAS
jgi:phage tail-like protein